MHVWWAKIWALLFSRWAYLFHVISVALPRFVVFYYLVGMVARAWARANH
jgi:hypothetical protein